MAQIVRPKGGMGPGFWPVTAVLGLLSLLATIGILRWDIASTLPEAAIPADQIDALFKFCSVFGSIIFIYVTGYLLYFTIAFRRLATTPDDAIGVQIHDNPKLELWWTIIPTILIVILGWFSVVIWHGITTAQGDVLTVEAIGYQFGFAFRYPELKDPVVNELHVPKGVPITLHVTSRDVLHGFWVPEVRLKADMVPGLINTIRFTPTNPGQYRVICTEFCGTLHGGMVAKFFVDDKTQYDKFISTQKSEQAKSAKTAGAGLPPGVVLANGKSEDGQKVFAAKCSSCHSVGPYAQKVVGPGLGHLFDDKEHPKLVNGKDVSPENIAGILKNGYNGAEGVMPNAAANAISNDDIASVDAYLVSLSKK